MCLWWFSEFDQLMEGCRQVTELSKWQEGAAGRQNRKEQKFSTFLQQLSWLTLPGKLQSLSLASVLSLARSLEDCVDRRPLQFHTSH